MSNNSFLDAAIDYASKGLAVFPCKPKGKEPITRKGVHDATTNFDTIKKWWTKHPSANIGIACGEVSGYLLVVDVDEKDNGVSGADSLNEWERENGTLPETVRSITGRGGSHLLYRLKGETSKNKVNLLEGVDIRSDGGYIIAPPSVHPNGRLYEWEYDPDEYPIAEADEVVRKLIDSDKPEQTDRFVMPDKVGSGKRNVSIHRLACSLQARGLTDSVILSTCLATNAEQCDPPLSEREVTKIVESALKYDKGASIRSPSDEVQLLTVTDSKGNEKVRQCAENVARVILNDAKISGKIKDDTFSHKLIYFGQLDWREPGDTMGEWTDKDDSALQNYLDIRYSLRNEKDYRNGFNIALLENKYDPLVGYLDALEWDGKPRIDTLLTDYLGADPSEYTISVMRVFLQGAVHRAYDPGCKFDYMPILIGGQGDGKTTFFKYLACNDSWFEDNFNFKNLDSKTVIESLSGRWILEMGEMDTLKKDAVTADALKAFITSQADRYRTPFDRRPEDRKRQCVFCGTSNDSNFLKDRTGNRRYLPIDCHKERATKDIFNEKEARPEFIQAIAEAVHIYKQDPDRLPVLPKNVQADAMQAQSDHLEEDSWVILIEDYLEQTDRDKVNVICIWEEGFGQDPVLQKRADINRMLTIMRHDITGWHEVGKSRIPGYGRGAICFERDKASPSEGKVSPSELKNTGFEAVGDTEAVPF